MFARRASSGVAIVARSRRCSSRCRPRFVLPQADVVAEGLDAPAGDRRPQHGEVRLATGRRERGGHVVGLALGADDADEQHVLGEPALVASDDRGDAQREALLREDRVAAVPRAVRPHLEGVGEVHDVLVVVARPRDIRLTGLERGTHRVHRLDPRSAGGDLLDDLRTDAGHDADRGDRVGAVGQLHADVGEGSADGTHRERHDVERAAPHRPVEQAREGRADLGRRDPVVRGSGVLLLLGGDEGTPLGAGDVAGV